MRVVPGANNSTGTNWSEEPEDNQTSDRCKTTYDANVPAIETEKVSGMPDPLTTIQSKDTDLTLSAAMPRRNGYIFRGWNTSKYGQTAKYKPGATVDRSIFSSLATITFYAVWEPIKYGTPAKIKTITEKGAVNVRRSETTDSKIDGSVYGGDEVTVVLPPIKGSNENDTHEWYQILSPVYGYVRDDFIEITGDRNNIGEYNCVGYALGVYSNITTASFRAVFEIVKVVNPDASYRPLLDGKNQSIESDEYRIAHRISLDTGDTNGYPKSFTTEDPHYWKQNPQTGEWWNKHGFNPIEYLGEDNGADSNGNPDNDSSIGWFRREEHLYGQVNERWYTGDTKYYAVKNIEFWP